MVDSKGHRGGKLEDVWQGVRDTGTGAQEREVLNVCYIENKVRSEETQQELGFGQRNYIFNPNLHSYIGNIICYK